MPKAKPFADSQYLSRIHAAELIDCSVQLIDKKIKLKQLTSYKFGRKTLIRKDELLRLLEVR
jgi:excisionase family DNA binding protein